MPNDIHENVWSDPIVTDAYDDGDDCVEYIRADMVKTTGFDDAPQWQGIDSAPRDGTSILTYPHYRVTHWSDNVLSVSGSGWAGRWDEYADRYAEVSKVDYWMPLPKPPTE